MLAVSRIMRENLRGRVSWLKELRMHQGSGQPYPGFKATVPCSLRQQTCFKRLHNLQLSEQTSLVSSWLILARWNIFFYTLHSFGPTLLKRHLIFPLGQGDDTGRRMEKGTWIILGSVGRWITTPASALYSF